GRPGNAFDRMQGGLKRGEEIVEDGDLLLQCPALLATVQPRVPQRLARSWKRALVAQKRVHESELTPDLFQLGSRRKEEALEAWRLEVPVDHDHAESLQAKPVRHVRKGHRTAHPSLVGVERVSHGPSRSRVKTDRVASLCRARNSPTVMRRSRFI